MGKEDYIEHINEFRKIIKDKQFIESHRVVSSAPFNLIMFPPPTDDEDTRGIQTPILGKMVSYGVDKFYLSNINTEIEELKKLSREYFIPILLIIRFKGDDFKPANYSIMEISQTMPTVIERNEEQKIEYL